MHKPLSINKFGGANIEKMDQVREVVKTLKQQGEKPVLIVSAFKGVTNALIAAMEELNKKGKKYSEQDISTAFAPVKSLHEKVIERFFPEPQQATVVRELFQEQFKIIQKSIHAHKDVPYLLQPIPGSFEIYDEVIAFGERMAGIFLEQYCNKDNIKAAFIRTVNCQGLEDSNDIASIDDLHRAMRLGIKTVFSALDEQEEVVIFSGHVGKTPRGMTVDIGRSFSDATAVDFFVALEEMNIKVLSARFWKEVDGVMTADPQMMEGSKCIPELIAYLSIKEALEAAGAGSLVIHPDALRLAMQHRVDLEIRNTKNPLQSGTQFIPAEVTLGKVNGELPRPFKLIIPQIVDTLTVSSDFMAHQPGFLAAMSKILDECDIEIDGVFTETTSVTFSFRLPSDNAHREAFRNAKVRKAVKALQRLKVREKIFETEVKWNQAVEACISIIGSELNGQTGITSQIAGVFKDFGIDIKGIGHAGKALRISIIIEEKKMKEAVQRLHERFIDARRAGQIK